ncbi:unnamed protein product [Meloidogyne enterolobii]|uniref:Uncharacterized protein n=1 Tax=Meloidogyne enterolobii TaxID=390850 RepID=A0ACB1A3B9_MELEN
MKLESFLIVLIFNWILLISVKTVPTRKGLTRHAEKYHTAKDLTKTLNVEAESSVNPQIQKHKEKLKSKLKNTKETDKGDMVNDRSEYFKEYRQKNKERIREYKRNYKIQNKERIRTY